MKLLNTYTKKSREIGKDESKKSKKNEILDKYANFNNVYINFKSKVSMSRLVVKLLSPFGSFCFLFIWK